MSLRKVLSFFPSLIKILFHRIVCDRLRNLGASVQTAESYSRATKAFCLWVAAQVEVAENHNWHVSQHPIRSQKLCSIFESLCAPSWPLDAPWPLSRCPCQWTPPSPPKWASPSRRLPITASCRRTEAAASVGVLYMSWESMSCFMESPMGSSHTPLRSATSQSARLEHSASRMTSAWPFSGGSADPALSSKSFYCRTAPTLWGDSHRTRWWMCVKYCLKWSGYPTGTSADIRGKVSLWSAVCVQESHNMRYLHYRHWEGKYMIIKGIHKQYITNITNEITSNTQLVWVISLPPGLIWVCCSRVDVTSYQSIIPMIILAHSQWRSVGYDGEIQVCNNTDFA